MKKNFKNVILIINTVLLVVCLFQIAELRSELQNMRNNTSHQLSSITGALNNSYSYIEEILAKEASIVSKAEWEFGEMNVKAGTIELNLYVIPKEYQQDVTEAYFLFGEEEVAAEFVDGKYEAAVNVPLFEEVSIPAVLFKENGIIRAEGLDWVFNPHQEFLPSVYAGMPGTISYGKTTDHKAKWAFSGDVEINVYAKYIEEFEVATAEIIRLVDGKELGRLDITMDGMTSHDTFSYNWNVDYEIPFGSEQEIFVDVTLRSGLVYRSKVSHCKIDSQGNPTKDEGTLEWMEARIYDTEGNLLYSEDEAWY